MRVWVFLNSCLEDRQGEKKKKKKEWERKKTLSWRLASLDLVTWPWPSSECVFDPVTHDSSCVLLLGYKSQIFLPYIQQVGITDNRKRKTKSPLVGRLPFSPLQRKKAQSKEVVLLLQCRHLLCWINVFPGGWMHGGGVGWGQEDRGKGSGKPYANINQHGTNYHNQKSFLIELGMHRSSVRDAFYYKWTQHTWIKTYKTFRLRYYYQDFQKYLRKFVLHIWGFLFYLSLQLHTSALRCYIYLLYFNSWLQFLQH